MNRRASGCETARGPCPGAGLILGRSPTAPRGWGHPCSGVAATGLHRCSHAVERERRSTVALARLLCTGARACFGTRGCMRVRVRHTSTSRQWHSSAVPRARLMPGRRVRRRPAVELRWKVVSCRAVSAPADGQTSMPSWLRSDAAHASHRSFERTSDTQSVTPRHRWTHRGDNRRRGLAVLTFFVTRVSGRRRRLGAAPEGVLTDTPGRCILGSSCMLSRSTLAARGLRAEARRSVRCDRRPPPRGSASAGALFGVVGDCHARLGGGGGRSTWQTGAQRHRRGALRDGVSNTQQRPLGARA